MHSARQDSPDQPVFGIVVMGGPMTGAMLRDVRLANELIQRGYEVHLWWAMDLCKTAGLDDRVKQHWLFHGSRLMGWPRGVWELAGKVGTRISYDHRRADFMQERQGAYERMIFTLINLLCDGVDRDGRVIQRFADSLEQAGVTHVLSSLGMLGQWTLAARPLMKNPPRHLVTFQGHELYLNHARRISREADMARRLAEVVKDADYPAIAVSEPYRQLVIDDLSLSDGDVVAVPPGVPMPQVPDRDAAMTALCEEFPDVDPDKPLITFLGRQDTEKGIDLLHYAAKILLEDGQTFGLAICGSSLFGKHYRYACEEIAVQLDLPYMRTKQVLGQTWSNLLAASHCVVYPSIIRETFGLVPVEAMAHGTPAVVPDYGGTKVAIAAEGKTGGLRFAPWDSGDLARQLRRLLTEPDTYNELATNARGVAEYYSVANMTTRILNHMGFSNSNQKDLSNEQGQAHPSQA